MKKLFSPGQRVKCRVSQHDQIAMSPVQQNQMPELFKIYHIKDYTTFENDQWFVHLKEIPGVQLSESLFTQAKRKRIPVEIPQ